MTLSIPLSAMGFLQSSAAAQTSRVGSDRASSCLFATDTPEILPEFADRKEYMEYMETVSALPEGFAVGTAKGVSASLNGMESINFSIIALTTHSFEDIFIRRSSRSRKPPD